MRAIEHPGRALALAALLVAAAPAAAAGKGVAAVEQTGQSDCWDEAGKTIDCAGTGQDGELRKGVSVAQRFVDNGDGTVTDRLTDLVWLKNATCFEPMKWIDALAAANQLADGSGCGLSDASRPRDWRMPNIKELHSLVDYGQFSPSFSKGHPFEGLKAGHYWSSTTMKGNPDHAFSLYLSYGVAGRNLKVKEYQLWPVRDPR